MSLDFKANGFEIVENKIRLNAKEIEYLKYSIKQAKNEDFGIETVLKIICWEDSKVSNSILSKIIKITSKVTRIDEKTLNENFSKDVYYTEQSKASKNRNQYPHFDWMPKIKAFLYLSENSNNDRGSIFFAKSSHKSIYMKIIKFIRNFSTPGYNYKRPPIFFKRFVKGLSFTEANARKFSLVIFDTDTIHHSGIVKLKDFTRIVLRFDFNNSMDNKRKIL